MKSKVNFKLLFPLFALLPFITLAQDGSLDTSFGTGGIVTNGTISVSGARKVLNQNDGKIIAVGSVKVGTYSDFCLVRYNINGSLDSTFGINGTVITSIATANDTANSATIQNDGKIVVAGFSKTDGYGDFSIVRYNSDGSLDSSFGTNGKVTTDFLTYIDVAESVIIQNDGKIVVTGHSDTSSSSGNQNISVVRYNTNGSLDTSFDIDGKMTISIGISCWANSVIIQSDGKIVVAGYSSYNFSGTTYNDFTIVRFNSNGSLDTSFDFDGVVITNFGTKSSFANSLSIQNDGKILVTGICQKSNTQNDNNAIVRYNIDGSLDTLFGINGKVITTVGNSTDESKCVILQNDGKILTAGSSNNGGLWIITIIRYNMNGSLDNSFDNDGIVITNVGTSSSAYSLIIQNDGKIVVSGLSYNNNNFYFTLVRYNNSALATSTFKSQTTNISVYPNPFSNQTTFQSEIVFENASLFVYNSIGQLVKTISNINRQLVTVSRDNLPSGLYFVNLFQENKLIGIEKLLITD